MKCPKFVAAMLASGMGIDPVEAECDKEECAWWDKRGEVCIMYSFAVWLFELQETLKAIKDKMPYEARFRK